MISGATLEKNTSPEVWQEGVELARQNQLRELRQSDELI